MAPVPAICWPSLSKVGPNCGPTLTKAANGTSANFSFSSSFTWVDMVSTRPSTASFMAASLPPFIEPVVSSTSAIS